MFFFSSSSKIKAIYTKAILENRVIVTRDHIKNLEAFVPPHAGVDYYLLCCMQKGVDPLSSSKFFTQVIREILNCHSRLIYDAVRADPELLTRFISPLLNSTYRPFSNIVCHILYSAYRIKEYPSVVENIDGAISLFSEIKKHPKFTSEFLWEHSESEEKLVNLLLSSKAEPGSTQEKIKKFFLDMRGLRTAEHEKQRLSFEGKRDEILAIAWSPERFMQWCLDTDEMARFLEYSKWKTIDPATKEIQRRLL
jgi:hypothetical protein